MADVVLLVIGAAIGFAVHEVLGRGVRAFDRRRAQRDPLAVHVESDPAIIWAGEPPWIGAGFLVPPEADVAAPPRNCPEWRGWAHARGGVDEALTQLRVTLTARRDVLVVVDGLRVRVSTRKPVPAWRVITCGAGGADITPRRAEIDLEVFDPPTVGWLDQDGDRIGTPTFSLSGSETEMLQIWARNTGGEWIEWTAELLVLVDGRRRVIEVSDNGRPFVTCGSFGAASQHLWMGGDDWDPPIPV